MSLASDMQTLGIRARHVASELAQADSACKERALLAMVQAIREHTPHILSANQQDLAAATELTPAARDRLMLNEARVEAMATAMESIAHLADPVGEVLHAWDVAQNGLHIEKVAVPLGVIGIIYEARPNVTADAAALCLKSGNAVILRCGSECFASSRAIVHALHEGLRASGIHEDAIQLVPTTDRHAVSLMLGMVEYIDIIVPRGGPSLTERVQQESRIPTIQHLTGNCHTYIHAAADPQKAVAITLNAKLRRTGVCGATESLLLDRAIVATLGASIIRALLDAGCDVRGDTTIQALDARVTAASESDWSTEYLAAVVSAKTVEGIDEAIAHINQYGSHHTDAILTEDAAAATRFTQRVDSAIVLVNASTQFADGGEFGFGGEIGISTGRLHARGPVGAAQLVTYKYVVTTAKKEGAVRS